MGAKHPSFIPEEFFDTYRFSRCIKDHVYGNLYEFINPHDGHQVLIQEIDLDIRIKNIKKMYDFHHPNLLHVFNFFATTGFSLKYNIGETLENDFEDDEKVDIAIIEVFQTDLY